MNKMVPGLTLAAALSVTAAVLYFVAPAGGYATEAVSVITAVILIFLLYVVNEHAKDEIMKTGSMSERCRDRRRMRGNETDDVRFREKMLEAIENNEITIYLQYIVDLKSGQIVGAEALSRWQHPEKGLLTPCCYLESVNKTEISDKLDLCILEKVCRLLEQWKNTEKRDFFLSCNFTRITISRDDFAERFLNIVGKYDFCRDKLIIELTEDSFIFNEETAYNNIMVCKNAGFKVALDDLGRGCTSFIDLCDYPVDIVKVDRDLVVKAGTDRGKVLLKGVSGMAHEMGIKVLHEGVENTEELQGSVNADCDYVQGYYFSQVFPLDEAEKFIKDSDNYVITEIAVQ